MLKTLNILFIFSNLKAGTPIASDAALYQIALNTLNSVRNLKEIITETRDFHETFEQIYGQVDQAVWRADRVAMWMNDVKELSQTEIQNTDDFIYVLGQIKSESKYLKNKIIEYDRLKNQSKKSVQNYEKKKKSGVMRSGKYTSESKASLSPTQAQLETAKNTKDISIEVAKLNAQISELSIQVAKLTELQRDQRDEITRKTFKESEKMQSLEKGILKQRDLEVR